jgi:hypothetical protein
VQALDGSKGGRPCNLNGVETALSVLSSSVFGRGVALTQDAVDRKTSSSRLGQRWFSEGKGLSGQLGSAFRQHRHVRHIL